ncbi:MAG: RidA family protein [Bryobacteraceae bacterium]
MFKASLVFFCSLAGLAAQDIRHIQPAGLSKAPTAYTHVVTARPGTVIWISGQISQNAKGEVVGKGDLNAQLNQVWENLRTALEAAGATFRDVVKINTYVVNYKPSMRDAIRAARSRHMGPGEPPAATLVGVQSLASADWLVEIEAVAVIR